jgi:hypothetical protein
MKIINISGESREYEENGYIYEFPSNSKFPTEVPEKIGEKLLKTNQFKKYENKIKKEVKNNDI